MFLKTKHSKTQKDYYVIQETFLHQSMSLLPSSTYLRCILKFEKMGPVDSFSHNTFTGISTISYRKVAQESVAKREGII